MSLQIIGLYTDKAKVNSIYFDKILFQVYFAFRLIQSGVPFRSICQTSSCRSEMERSSVKEQQFCRIEISKFSLFLLDVFSLCQGFCRPQRTPQAALRCTPVISQSRSTPAQKRSVKIVSSSTSSLQKMQRYSASSTAWSFQD